MATIELTTEINAPIERCFLLSLSVDVHTEGAKATGEKAVAGITRGILKLNDTVTWEARHFGVRQRLTSRVSAYSFPNYFITTMIKGAFSRIYHQHIFHETGSGTVMTDLFEYKAPFGPLGLVAEKLFLDRYLRKFLLLRNATLKRVAESAEWENYLLPTKKPSANERAA